ncbi:MAG: metallophosphoesterase [Gammaproteobacteria bacterium]
MIRWNNHTNRLPIIHMGDAIDVSCRTEWDRFARLMQTSNVEWVMVPGNHDGYFEGIICPEEEHVGRDWAADRKTDNSYYGNLSWDLRCNAEDDQRTLVGKNLNPDQRSKLRYKNLRKQQFIDAYRKAVGLQINGCGNLKEANDEVAGTKSGHTKLIRCAVWKLTPETPWKSFLLQVVDISGEQPDCNLTNRCAKTWGVLLDTSQFLEYPKLSRSRNAGQRGEFLKNQVEAAEQLIAAIKTDSSESRFVLIGHHPIRELEPAKMLLKRLIDAGAEPFYVSAHTHEGYWENHTVGRTDILELNVGSLLDAPVHFRDFQLLEASGQYVVSSKPYLFSTKLPKGNTTPFDLTCAEDWLSHYRERRSSKDERVRLNEYTTGKIWGHLLAPKEAQWEDQIQNLKAELLEYKELHSRCSRGISEYDELIKEIERLYRYNPRYGTDSGRFEYQYQLRRLREFEDQRTNGVECASLYKACLAVEAANHDPDYPKLQDASKMNRQKACIARERAIAGEPVCKKSSR